MKLTTVGAMPKTGSLNMLGLEIRRVMQGKEVSVDSLVEAIVRQIRSSLHEEISRPLSGEQNLNMASGPC